MGKLKLDDLDHQILDILIDNARVPFTDISKRLLISAGTVHVRVKKMEDAGIIKGSSLNLDYEKLGYSFIAYIGVYLEKDTLRNKYLNLFESIPYITVAHITMESSTYIVSCGRASFKACKGLNFYDR